MIALTLSLLLSQAVNPSLRMRVDDLGEGYLYGWGYAQVPSVAVSPFASFEFAPSTGGGMGAACACAAVTGAKGEAMTFTRAGSATCTKGNLTAGIVAGDLVTCSTDQPRVGNPDGSGLKLLLEPSRVNSALQSKALNAANWLLAGSSTAPTVTTDAVASPDGTTNAERVDFPAVSGGGAYSVIYQSIVTTAAAWSGAVYVMGVSGSGTIYATFTANGVLYNTGTCNYVAGSWIRCLNENRTLTVAATSFEMGVDLRDGAESAKSAQSVYLWQADVQLGATMSSPIPTTTLAVTRAADSAPTFTVAATGPSFSLAASALWPSSNTSAVNVVSLGTAAPDLVILGRTSNTAAAYLINATSTTPTVTAMGSTLQRGALADAAGTRTAIWQGSTVSAPASSMSASSTAITLGVLNGYVGNVCLDPASSRCR